MPGRLILRKYPEQFNINEKSDESHDGLVTFHFQSSKETTLLFCP